MKVACTSDTHGRAFNIPECDVFIHAGDMTAGGSRRETDAITVQIADAIFERRIRYAIIVPGNHDEFCDMQEDKARDMFECIAGLLSDTPQHVFFLINSGCEIEGKKFWGSPFTPPFMQWWFMAKEDKLAGMYKSIPETLDVLITHGPPRGILDPGYLDPHVGSRALLDAVAGRKIRHHIFGHLHGAGGKSVDTSPLGPIFHNVSACNDAYRLVRQPLILEI
jgi:Icc-related predicted phosphoesterase